MRLVLREAWAGSATAPDTATARGPGNTHAIHDPTHHHRLEISWAVDRLRRTTTTAPAATAAATTASSVAPDALTELQLSTVTNLSAVVAGLILFFIDNGPLDHAVQCRHLERSHAAAVTFWRYDRRPAMEVGREGKGEGKAK